MKIKTISGALLALAIAGALSACDENSWNDKLDGFKEMEEEPVVDQQAIEYTLTEADYSLIASNSTNVALAGDDRAALSAVGTQKAFSAAAPASVYVPAFLSSTSFPYFALTDGSSVRLTYDVMTAADPVVLEAAGTQQYTISDDQYAADVWGSDEDFIAAFAPSHQAANYIPALLAANVDPEVNPYCVVTYNYAAEEPVFGSGDEPEPPVEFEATDVLGSVAKGDDVTVRGVVMAICAQGYMVADKSGTIFVYMGSSFDAGSVAIGQQLEIVGSIGAYNGGLQVTGSSATVTLIGTQNVEYPEAKTYTGAELDGVVNREGDYLGIYGSVTGKVVVTEKNINIVVDGAETAQGSVYGFTDAVKALLTDGSTQTITGYFIAVAAKRYCNFVVTAVDGTPVYKAAEATALTAPVATESLNAVYYYDGAKWVVPANFSVLNPGTYAEMGQRYKNLSTAEPYLSTWLARTFPYAVEGDVRNVLWLHYANGATAYDCTQYVYNGFAWTAPATKETETSQFVKANGKWMYDPNVTISLPAGRGVEISTLYYQACVDWVYNNICVPLGDTSIKSGKFYVSSYGNNEYYSGTSAYQGNVDLRPSAARDQYPAEYSSMSDDEIVALEKTRFMNEVMPGALAALHSDAKPIDGIDVYYTINFVVYTGASTDYTAVFKVVGPGKFEPVSCTWDE